MTVVKKKYWIWMMSLLYVIAFKHAAAQTYLVSGKVFDNKLQPLPYVSLFVKDNQQAVTSNDTGGFSFRLPKGRFEIVATLVGYKTSTQVVIINKEDVAGVKILMPTDNKGLGEIKILGAKKDRSEEIIRQVIIRKDILNKPVNTFSCAVYTRGSIQDIDSFKNDSKKKNTDTVKNIDSIRLADSSSFIRNKLAGGSLAEVISVLDFQYPNKIKETRTAVKKRGEMESMYYLRATDGDYNFYNNLLHIPSISEATLLSPISSSGLIAYRYKMLSITEVNGKNLFRIKVSPTSISNSLLSGEIFIEDSTFAIRKLKLKFPEHQLGEYSSFTVEQEYEDYGEGQQHIWLLKQQRFDYVLSKKTIGTTQVLYKNYTIDTLFPKKYFGEELSSTLPEAYDKDSSFWQRERAVPLNDDEMKLLAYKDSVYNFTHSKKYYDSIDKKANKITIGKIAWGGIANYKRSNERTVQFNSLLGYGLRHLFDIGGPRISQRITHSIRTKSYKRWNTSFDLHYGILNKDILGEARVSYLYNPFKQSKIEIDGGERVGTLVQNDAAINYLSRTMYYRNKGLNLQYGTEIRNGLYITGRTEYSNRSSLNNYKFFSGLIDTILKENKIPVFGGSRNEPIAFPSYNVIYGSLIIRYVHKQKYIREPRQKVVLGSKYPTVTFTYRKGIKGLLGSVVDFDYIELKADKEQNIGTAGVSKASLTYGNFLRKVRLEVPDYKWVSRGQLFIFLNPEFNFQALDSTMPINKGYVEGHYYHQFNGALINKIPYAKYLKIFESAGSSLLIMPERNLRYIEFYAGLDKQFRLFKQSFRVGIYAVSSFANQFQNPLQWKIGLKHYDNFSNRWE
jgi:hypothetical protein